MRRSRRPEPVVGLDGVGAALKRTRTARRLTQRSVAEHAAVHQTTVSRVERGRLPDVTVRTLARLCAALEVNLVLQARSPVIFGRAEQRDRVHALCVGAVRRGLTTDGWLVAVELEIVEPQARGWIDLLAFDPTSHRLLVIEVKTEIHDLGAVQRQLGWYARAAWPAAQRIGWRPRRADAILVVLATTTNDEFLQANRESIRDAFPVRGRAVATLVDRATEPSGRGWALAMVDPRRRRRRWELATRMDGRRGDAPYRDYRDCARQRSSR
jgi:transcriptional regulator with XRE-family HTH domain